MFGSNWPFSHRHRVDLSGIFECGPEIWPAASANVSSSEARRSRRSRAISLGTSEVLLQKQPQSKHEVTASQSPLGYAALRVTKPYPTGGAHRVDAAYKAKVVSRLKEKGWTQKRLAEEIGCDPSAITVLLKPATVQSRLVPAINDALGLGEPAPTLAPEQDELDAALMRAIRSMDEKSKRHLLGITEAMVGPRPKNTPKG